MRLRRRFAATGYLGLAVALACSPAKTAAPAPGVDFSLRSFLLDPTVDCGTSLAEPLAVEIRRAYRELLLSAEAPAALRVAERVTEGDANLLAAQTLRAEALLVASRPREASDSLKPFSARAPECLPLALVLGRSLEEAADLPEAYAVYMEAAGRSDTAAQRARAISSLSLEAVRARFVEALRAGRGDEASGHLLQLERFWPNSEASLLSAMERARAAADASGELAAARALQALHPSDTALTLRLGQLELQVGDARTGLALVEALAAAAPADVAVQMELARAKFSWRLLNAPEQVRGLREKAALSRADFAVLLYWTVPQIRTARPGAMQIASDIVDHPSREEIARVANLGLMTIEETLHRFSPEAGLRQADAVAALLRLLADSGKGRACSLARAGGREGTCRAAVACGLVDDPVLCQAGAGLSGSEAIEMLRRALDRLEDS